MIDSAQDFVDLVIIALVDLFSLLHRFVLLVDMVLLLAFKIPFVQDHAKLATTVRLVVCLVDPNPVGTRCYFVLLDQAIQLS